MCQGNRFNQTNPETDPSTALAQAHDRLSHKHPTLFSQAHLKKPEMLVCAKVPAVMRGCRGSLPGCYYAVAMAFRESLLQILGCLPTGSCTYHPSLSWISQEAVVTVMTGMFFGIGPESVCLLLKPSTLADMLLNTFADSRVARPSSLVRCGKHRQHRCVLQPSETSAYLSVMCMGVYTLQQNTFVLL